MRLILLLLFAALASFVYGQGKSYDYCYKNQKGICVYSVADKKEYLILKQGFDPCISPNGRKIAYTIYSKSDARTIVVIDINSKQKTFLKTNSQNCFGPVWSPDGKYIAYNVFNWSKSRWSIAIIDAGNTLHKVLTGQLNCNSPTWTVDSKNVVAQNMSSIFVLDLFGKIIATYKISDLSKESSPTSADRYVFTASKKIVFNSEVNVASDKDEPPLAIFVYDIFNKKSLKITSKEYNPFGIIVKNNKILFTTTNIKPFAQNIYTIDMDGKNLKILFKNCSDISAKN
jgi:TolB protein